MELGLVGRESIGLQAWIYIHDRLTKEYEGSGEHWHLA